LNRKKELHWHGVDFTERKILTLTKGKKSFESKRQHPRVMQILAKWKAQGFEAPLPFAYGKLRQYVNTMNEILGIEFTAHDLRRLKSQMSEAELNDIAYAAAAIGDTSTGMVSKHYAPQSDATMDKINNAVSDRLNRIAEMN
jgi:integrase